MPSSCLDEVGRGLWASGRRRQSDECGSKSRALQATAEAIAAGQSALTPAQAVRKAALPGAPSGRRRRLLGALWNETKTPTRTDWWNGQSIFPSLHNCSVVRWAKSHAKCHSPVVKCRLMSCRVVSSHARLRTYMAVPRSKLSRISDVYLL